MDFCGNVSPSSEYHQQEQLLQSPPLCSKFAASLNPVTSLDDLFSAQNTEVDVSLEWLSVFVEDCLSSTGDCLPPPRNSLHDTNTTAPEFADTLKQKPHQSQCSLENFVVPGKARSKRKRVTSARTGVNPLTNWSYGHHQTLHFASSHPPLLHQTCWLADSELIVPKKVEEETTAPAAVADNSNKARRCTHCLSQKTPQWRAGPLGPKTLCNACGVRYKSGRLLPEYRPAKSPTFVSHLHSNSHKKVLQMRKATSSSSDAD